MTVTIIGCYGAYPAPGEATAGYLLEDGETKVLLECGSGVLTTLSQRLPLSELDGTVLTHYHFDHCADLGCLQYAVMVETQLQKRTKPFCAWGPGDEQRLNYLPYCQGYSYIGKDEFQIGPFTFHTFQTQHDVQCYAIKVTDTRGRTLVFTGDTGYYEPLAAFAAGTDCFLCEATFYTEPDGGQRHHLTSLQASRLACAAHAKQLVLTHLPHFGDVGQLAETARNEYNGTVLLARQWMRITI